MKTALSNCCASSSRFPRLSSGWQKSRILWLALLKTCYVSGALAPARPHQARWDFSPPTLSTSFTSSSNFTRAITHKPETKTSRWRLTSWINSRTWSSSLFPRHQSSSTKSSASTSISSCTCSSKLKKDAPEHSLLRRKEKALKRRRRNCLQHLTKHRSKRKGKRRRSSNCSKSLSRRS